jgi:2-amino-4-hydroxy-6-hydroxymethyldihydropteridine diphosphokinase
MAAYARLEVAGQVSPDDVWVQCRANGQLRQDGRTSDMVHSAAALVAFIGLGTNVGRRLDNLAEARRRLALLGVHQPGPVVETAALLPREDPSPQAPYLNSVDRLSSSLSAVALFEQLKRIEREMGRVASTRWAPRLIDLDLLLYGETEIRSDVLTVPHPRMHERRFVLEPLTVLQPDAWHPLLRCTARELLLALCD